ncbi:MAG: FAD-dependent thymidylate synthase [archaeon]
MSYEKKVSLVAWLQNSFFDYGAEDAAASGARGCFSEKCSADIHFDEARRNDYEARKEKIFAETSGRGHGAVLDQSGFVFSLDNLTRASTLFLCGPQYGSHLQQSLRRATAERGFHFPEGLNEEARAIMESQFKLYDEMQEAGIPAEDARFILPLYTRTTIQTLWNARELMHLDSMSKREGVPSEVRDTVKQMIGLAKEVAPRLMADRDENYEPLAWMPSSQLFAGENKTIENLAEACDEEVALLDHSRVPMSDMAVKMAVSERDEAEIANLKHYHYSFLARMSLAAFHQATRQRTWDQSVQTLRGALARGDYVIPPSIELGDFEERYRYLNGRAMDFAFDRLSDPDALGVLPHSLQVVDLIHVNGWNAIYSIGKRTCEKAQWEIRGIAQKMAGLIKGVSPEVGQFAIPQGITYGRCPERESCGECF